MNILDKYINITAAIITIVGGIIAVYFAFYEKHIQLNVQTISSELLTSKSSSDSITVQYYYQDSIAVKNLWRVQYVIRNTGDMTLIGMGNDSKLLGESLPFSFKDTCQVFSMIITNSNNAAHLQNNNIYFKQWRTNEFVELTAFIESKNEPQLYLDDRDIVDSEIVYSRYNPEQSKKYYCLADYIPIWIVKTLKTIYLIVLAFFTLAVISYVFLKSNNKKEKTGTLFILFLMLLPLLWMLPF